MFKVRDGFQVWTSPLGTVLVGLESRRLEACLKFAIDMSADGVVLSRYHGFAEAKHQLGGHSMDNQRVPFHMAVD